MTLLLSLNMFSAKYLTEIILQRTIFNMYYDLFFSFAIGVGVYYLVNNKKREPYFKYFDDFTKRKQLFGTLLVVFYSVTTLILFIYLYQNQP